MADVTGIDRQLTGQALTNVENVMLATAKVQANVPIRSHFRRLASRSRAPLLPIADKKKFTASAAKVL
jgi:hypothetical protein